MKNAIFFMLSAALTAACGGDVSTNKGLDNSASNSTNAAATNSAYRAAPQTVTITSPDGLQIVGTFLESDKPNSPALLLLHQWQSDRHSYDDFAARMQNNGFAVLSIDGRGFGESTKKTDGSTVAAERTSEAVKSMLDDVGAGYDFLVKQKNVDPNRVGIVGASYGSSLAIMFAADHPNIPVVALLSPGLNYFGNMQTQPAVEKYGNRHLLIIASKGDTESAQALESFQKVGNPRYGFMVLSVGSSHGTEMFKYRDRADGPPVVEDALDSFLITRLGLAK